MRVEVLLQTDAANTQWCRLPNLILRYTDGYLHAPIAHIFTASTQTDRQTQRAEFRGVLVPTKACLLYVHNCPIR